jgi:hypothetical protein
MRAKKRPTWLSHEAEVDIKWICQRGWRASQAPTWDSLGDVVVDDQMDVELGRHIGLDVTQNGKKFLMTVAGSASRVRMGSLESLTLGCGDVSNRKRSNRRWTVLLAIPGLFERRARSNVLRPWACARVSWRSARPWPHPRSYGACRYESCRRVPDPVGEIDCAICRLQRANAKPGRHDGVMGSRSQDSTILARDVSTAGSERDRALSPKDGCAVVSLEIVGVGFGRSVRIGCLLRQDTRKIHKNYATDLRDKTLAWSR